MKKFLALLILIICIPSYANNILHDAETILPGANKAKKAEILFYAVKAKNYTIINLALQYNAKADYQDEQGYTTLMYAAQNLSLEYVQRLLDAGGSKTVTYTNFLGMTALNYAETRTYTSSDMTQKPVS